MAVRKFCWCIPTRLGVLLLSPLVSVTAVLLLMTEAYSLHQVIATPGSVWRKISMIVFCVVAATLAVSALVGFVGACTKSRRAMKIYNQTLWFCLWFMVGVSIWQLASRGSSKDRAIQDCANRLAKAERPFAAMDHKYIAPSREDLSICRATFDASFGILFVLALLLMLLLLSVCIVTARYVRELDETPSTLPMIQLYQYDGTAEPLPPSAYNHPPMPSPAYEPPRPCSGSPRSSFEGKYQLKEVKL